jgi:nucleotide-binding universal stress UspA family protein
MPKQKIMIAYDDSEHSRRALEWAVQLGRRLGSPLEIVQVLPTISYFQLHENDSLRMNRHSENKHKNLKERLSEKLQQTAKQYTTPDFIIDTKVLDGAVAESLLAYSQETEACLLVTGTRGAGGFRGLLLGSVAHELVTYAKIPVVVIK